MKHYSITIAPALTPSEWFFHVRNMRDEVYQAGYNMIDEHDCDEKSRLSILSMPEISKLEGIISNESKVIDKTEFRRIIEAYLQKQGNKITIEDMSFDDSSKETVLPKKAGKISKHYSIVIEPALSAAEWFFHVRSLAEHVAESGYYLDDFRDGYILDRQSVLTGQAHAVFEGFVSSDTPIATKTIENHVINYLSTHRLTLVEMSL